MELLTVGPTLIKQKNKTKKIFGKKKPCKSRIFGGSDPMNELTAVGLITNDFGCSSLET